MIHETCTRTIGEAVTQHSVTLPDGPKPPSNPDPAFHEKIRKGKILRITEWSRTKYRSEPGGSVSVTQTRNSTGATLTNSYEGNTGYHPGIESGYSGSLPVSGRLVAALTQQAVGRAKTAGWDVGTFLAELHKTVGLVANAADTTRDRIGSIKSLIARKRYRRTMLVFAKQWLEYRYGWRQILFDINGAQDAMSRVEKKVHLDRYTAQNTSELVPIANLSNTGDWTGTFYWAGGSGNTPLFRNRWKMSVEKQSTVRVGAGVEVNYLNAFTLGPAVTTWELMKYSFVIDWFLNTGDVIAAHTPVFGRKLAYLWRSDLQDTKFTRVQTVDPPPDSSTYTYAGGGESTWVGIRSQYRRRPLSTDIPFSVQKRVRFDSAKLADSISLLMLEHQKLLRWLDGSR